MRNLIRNHPESFYHQLFDSLPVAFYYCNKEGRITFYNDKAARLWGYEPNLDEVKFCACHKLWSAEGEPIAPDETPMAWVIENAKPYRNAEAWVEKPDGSQYYASINIFPLFDPEGNFLGAMNMFQDISDWKNAERGLLESEGRYRQLITSLPVAIYTIDARGRITLYNDAAAQLWGREPRIGQDLWCGSWKIYKTEGTPLPLDECPMAITIREAKRVIGETIVVERPNGTRRFVVAHPSPIVDSAGKIQGGVNMLVDITEQKRAEQILRENEERLRLVVEASELGTWDMDISSGSVITSKQHSRILGYDEGLDWDREKFYAVVHPEDLPMVKESIQRAMVTGKLFYEARIRWRNKKTKWIRVTGKTVVQDGVPVRLLGTTTDITAQKEANDHLEKAVAERTKELRCVNKQLEKSNHDLEQFAFIASHDLQEPLRKIQTFLTLVERAKEPKVQREYISKIHSSAQSMSTLIKDVLSYSRLSKLPEFEHVDLNKVLDSVKSGLEVAIADKKATIKAGQLPILKGIPRQFEQLFSNIISNSLKFSTAKPIIEISADTLSKDDSRRPSGASSRECILLSFKDNGIGFEQLYADQIFEIFQRLNKKETYPGTGVGLALCKKIVENHNGHISAQSRPGRGTTIIVVLPV